MSTDYFHCIDFYNNEEIEPAKYYNENIYNKNTIYQMNTDMLYSPLIYNIIYDPRISSLIYSPGIDGVIDLNINYIISDYRNFILDNKDGCIKDFKTGSKVQNLNRATISDAISIVEDGGGFAIMPSLFRFLEYGDSQVFVLKNLMIPNSPHINYKFSDYYTPMGILAMNSHKYSLDNLIGLTDSLLENGANPNLGAGIFLPLVKKEENGIKLRLEEVEYVKWLINRYPEIEINRMDSDKETALHYIKQDYIDPNSFEAVFIKVLEEYGGIDYKEE